MSRNEAGYALPVFSVVRKIDRSTTSQEGRKMGILGPIVEKQRVPKMGRKMAEKLGEMRQN